MARKKRVWFTSSLISNRRWVIYCAAAIWREEDTAIEDLNTPVCFIHDHNFFLLINQWGSDDVNTSYVQSAENEIRCWCLWCDGWDGFKNQRWQLFAKKDASERVTWKQQSQIELVVAMKWDEDSDAENKEPSKVLTTEMMEYWFMTDLKTVGIWVWNTRDPSGWACQWLSNLKEKNWVWNFFLSIQTQWSTLVTGTTHTTQIQLGLYRQPLLSPVFNTQIISWLGGLFILLAFRLILGLTFVFSLTPFFRVEKLLCRLPRATPTCNLWCYNTQISSFWLGGLPFGLPIPSLNFAPVFQPGLFSIKFPLLPPQTPL